MGRILESVSAGSLAIWNELPPIGRDWLIRNVFEPQIKSGKCDRNTQEAIYAADYDIIPPTPTEFLDSDAYMRHAAKEIYPAWRPHILDVCDPTSGIYEMEITGASGLGKTFAACAVFSYKITRIFCLRNPSEFYGLQGKSRIYFGLYAVSKKMVKKVGFEELKHVFIGPSPFFKERFPPLPHGQEYIRWDSKPVEITVGSSRLHAVGLSLMAVLGDELNWFDQGQATAEKARDLVSEVSRRLESRFVDEAGDIPGIAIYVSQTRTSSDFLELRMKEKKGVPGVRAVRGPRWAFNPKGYSREKGRGFRADLGDPYFRVFTGTETADPRILDRVTRSVEGNVSIEPIDENDLPPEDQILKVPVLHYRAFMDDLHGSLQAIADVPTGSFAPFFPRREIIRDALDVSLPFPFSMQIIPCYEKSEVRLQETYAHELVTRVEMGKLRPIRHPAAPRYIAIDLAFGRVGGDRAGFAMVHPSDHRIENRQVADDRSQVGETEALKAIEVDFYVALVGGQYGEPIDFRKIRVFVEWLRKIGYPIALVSCDQFQSEDNLQRLRDLGFKTTKTSTRRTSKPYRDLRQVLNEARLGMAWPPAVLRDVDVTDHHALEQATSRVLLFQELSGLEHNMKTDQVDHRENNPDGTRGSNDIADALASAVHCCLNDQAGPGTEPIIERPRQMMSAKYNRYLEKLNKLPRTR